MVFSPVFYTAGDMDERRPWEGAKALLHRMDKTVYRKKKITFQLVATSLRMVANGCVRSVSEGVSARLHWPPEAWPNVVKS